MTPVRSDFTGANEFQQENSDNRSWKKHFGAIHYLTRTERNTCVLKFLLLSSLGMVREIGNYGPKSHTNISWPHKRDAIP